MKTSLLLVFLTVCIAYATALKGDDCEGKSIFIILLKCYVEIKSSESKIQRLFINTVLILVCVSVINRFMNTLSKDDKSNKDAIEKQFKKFCKDLKLKENRFCYFLGGTADAATGILGEMSKPMSWGVPADKICEKLKKKDKQICELRYGKLNRSKFLFKINRTSNNAVLK